MNKFEIDVPINKGDATRFFYIDDFIFSGNRVIQDVTKWVASAPDSCALTILVMGWHAYGKYYAEKKIFEVVKDSKKNIKINWACRFIIEDRKSEIDNCDVLRPAMVSSEKLVLDYIEAMTYKPVYRSPGKCGPFGIFSSEAGRNVLEQEFLNTGALIKQKCPNLKKQHRPLGYSGLETLGFGSMIITYRNCPNNAPLALWAGEPWYPLLPRSTNADAKMKRASEDW